MCLSTAAFADVDLTAADACLTDRLSQNQSPASCVDQAHQRCLTTPEDLTASAVLCFGQARKAWSIGIAANMEQINETADDRIAAIAAVELKYDMLANLMQCDRMEELAKAGSDATGDQISRQRAQCEASAAGLVYLRVKMRSQSLQ
jgi:hypothetical protein